MKRFGLRGKLLAISVLLVATVMAATALYVDNVLDEQLRHLGAEEALYFFRWPLLVGLVIGLGLAVGMSVLATRLMSREMRQLVEVARELSGASTPTSAPVTKKDVSNLAGSLKRLRDELEEGLEALATARDRFSHVVDALNEPVIACDADGNIIMLNRAARLSLPLEEGAVGRPLIEFLRAHAFQELLKATEPIELPFELPGPPRRIFQTSVRPDEDGTRVLVVRDVTEVRRLETMRRDFVSNVSHELRTPISVISANAETLTHGALDNPDKAHRFIEAIARNAKRLGLLVEDLLDLNRIESGKERIELTVVDAATACQQAIQTMEQRAAHRQVRLVNTVADGMRLIADPRALDQVLVNLIDNAIKYGATNGTVALRAETVGEHVRVAVEDDGTGIDPTHRDRIFERFYRIDRGRSRNMGGTGLGLAIVKHLVESMGGTVGIEGIKPTGSRFWIEFPRPSGLESSPSEQAMSPDP